MADIDLFKDWLLLNRFTVTRYADNMRVYFRQEPIFDEVSFNRFILKQRLNHLPGTLNNYIKAAQAYSKFVGVQFKLPQYFEVTDKLPAYMSFEFFEKEIIPTLPLMFEHQHLKIKALLYFMFFCGQRKHEIEVMKRSQINFKEGTFLAYNLKSKNERLIPLAFKLIPILKEYFAQEPEVNNAFNLGGGSLQYIFDKLKTNWPDKHIHPHMYKHSCAIHLQRNGFTTREIQHVLGHQSILTTAKYERVHLEFLQKKFNQL
jgi:integrase